MIFCALALAAEDISLVDFDPKNLRRNDVLGNWAQRVLIGVMLFCICPLRREFMVVMVVGRDLISVFVIAAGVMNDAMGKEGMPFCHNLQY
jgi:hypothetical protein